ncbi:hypothetical protein BJ508DRAFT_337557 [Ascobolus immersus RN42]|uniref:Uncharacterized protein n=1 Tax=Ascobolus immersus RN42 TaxID=1160509 RepID=A0A3N4IR71_ASCIM|nr:hypothetical protein BJ508DRAFT_337557 [Ascobolus immersus RN42]
MSESSLSYVTDIPFDYAVSESLQHSTPTTKLETKRARRHLSKMDGDTTRQTTWSIWDPVSFVSSVLIDYTRISGIAASETFQEMAEKNTTRRKSRSRSPCVKAWRECGSLLCSRGVGRKTEHRKRLGVCRECKADVEYYECLECHVQGKAPKGCDCKKENTYGSAQLPCYGNCAYKFDGEAQAPFKRVPNDGVFEFSVVGRWTPEKQEHTYEEYSTRGRRRYTCTKCGFTFVCNSDVDVNKPESFFPPEDDGGIFHFVTNTIRHFMSFLSSFIPKENIQTTGDEVQHPPPAPTSRLTSDKMVIGDFDGEEWTHSPSELGKAGCAEGFGYMVKLRCLFSVAQEGLSNGARKMGSNTRSAFGQSSSPPHHSLDKAPKQNRAQTSNLEWVSVEYDPQSVSGLRQQKKFKQATAGRTIEEVEEEQISNPESTNHPTTYYELEQPEQPPGVSNRPQLVLGSEETMHDRSSVFRESQERGITVQTQEEYGTGVEGIFRRGA